MPKEALPPMPVRKPYPLSKEQIRLYRENGFVALPDVLEREEVRALRRILTGAVRDRKRKHADGLIQTNPRYEKVFAQMVNLWEDYEEFRPFILNSRLADIARRLVGCRSIRLWHDHALIKPPFDGAPTPWHQDFPYWPMKEPGALSCWLALDDVDESNGCMSFVPGTHRLGALAPVSLTHPSSLFKVAGLDRRKHRPKIVRLKAGSCTFHDGNTFHHAGPNRSAKPRRALAIIYMPAGVTYDGKPHCVTDGCGLRVGGRFSGKRFPVLARS